MNKAIYILCISSFLLGACAKDALTPQREEIEVRVGIDALAETRVNQAGNGFVDKDEFRLYMGGRPTTDGATLYTDYTYNATDNKWNTGAPLYWDDRTGAPFCAVSPIPAMGGYEIAAGTSGKDTYSVQADQSTVDNYIKSDLLIARSVATERLLDIEFKHAFCKVVVKITSETTGTGAFTLKDFENAVVTLSQKQVKGEIEYPAGTETVIATAVTGGTPQNITMYKVGTPATLASLEYAAIIPQQDVTIDGSTLLITLTKVGTAGNTYTYTPKGGDLALNGGTTALTQGKQTTITMKLTKTGVELDATGEIKIEPWAEGPTGTDDGAIVLPKN